MTIDEAIRHLSLEVPCTEDELRRTYLRALRHSKPEADPDGFMRVRAAYDRLRGMAETLGERADEPEHDEPEREDEAPDLAAAIPAELSRCEPVIPAEEEAVCDGVVEHVGLRVHFATEALAEALERDQLATAAELTLEFFTRAGPDDDPPIDEAIELMLRLYEIGRVDVARSIGARVAHWLYCYADERRVMAGARIVRWSHLRDLDSLPDEVPIPPIVRSVLASFARNEDVVAAGAALRNFAWGYPGAAATAGREMRRYLPTFGSLANELDPPRPVTDRPVNLKDPGTIIAVVLGVLFVTALCLLFAFSTTPGSGSNTTEPPPPIDGETRALLDRLRAEELLHAASLVEDASNAAALGQCPRVDSAVGELPRAVLDAPPSAHALQPDFVKLVARLSRVCPALLPAKADPARWPFTAKNNESIGK